MNKKSKEIVKKLCFTLVVVISIITIIGCPNTVSNKTGSGADKPSNNGIPWTPLYDPNDWSGLTADQVIQKMSFKEDDPIVTDYRGLGFGRKPKEYDKLYYQVYDSYTDDGIVPYYQEPGLGGNIMRVIDFDAMGGYIKTKVDPSYTITPFTTVKDGLEERWRAKSASGWISKSSDCTSEVNSYILNFLKIPLDKLKNKELYTLGTSLHYIVAYGGDKVFVCTGGSLTKHFVDWHIVFVPKDGSPAGLESYSFHFGPYTLWDKEDISNNQKPSIYVNYNEYVRMFTLSRMLEDYLRESKKLTEDQISAVKSKFSPLNADKGEYDVYLVIGKFNINGSSKKSGYAWAIYSFRNVFKLNDPCWNDFWEKHEAVDSDFPSLSSSP